MSNQEPPPRKITYAELRSYGPDVTGMGAIVPVSPVEAAETFYLLVCRECGNGDLVMPFASAAERGKWAAEHTKATGHDTWLVRDENRLSAGAGAGIDLDADGPHTA